MHLTYYALLGSDAVFSWSSNFVTDGQCRIVVMHTFYGSRLNAKTETICTDSKIGWLRGSVVERRSSAGVVSLSCARPVADG